MQVYGCYFVFHYPQNTMDRRKQTEDELKQPEDEASKPDIIHVFCFSQTYVWLSCSNKQTSGMV